MSRGTNPQGQTEEETSATGPAETSAEGGWGLAKQLQESEDDEVGLKEER